MQGVVDLEPPVGASNSPGESSSPGGARRDQSRSKRVAPPRRYYKGKAPYVFLLPYLLLTSVFFVYPFLLAVSLAFYQTNGPRSQLFVGLDNFLFLVQDTSFLSALTNTVVYTSHSLMVQFPLALGLAIFLNSGTSKLELRLKGIFRLILFSPNLVGPVFVGVLLGVMLTPRYGLVNRTLHALVGWGL